jgi:O-antigen/teichoic acid export membrane protein
MLKILAKKSGANLVIRILGSIFSLLMSAYVAKNYSLIEAGIFFLMVSYVTIFSTISIFGLNNELLRKASKLYSKGNIKELSILFTSCIFSMLILAFCISLVLYISNLSFVTPQLLLCIPLISVITFSGILLQSSNKFVHSSLVQFVLLPAFLLLNFLFLPNRIKIEDVYLLSIILTSCIGLYLVWKTLEYKFYFRYKLTVATRSLIFFQILLVINQNIGQLLLNMFDSKENIAIYSVSKKLTMLLGFAISALNAVVAPQMAAAFSKGDISKLQLIVKSSSRLLLGFSVPAIFVVVCFPNLILSLFGDKYSTELGVNIFLILAVGQLINIVTGTVAYLLIVTKNEKAHLLNLIIAIFLSLFLYLFIYPFGIYGIAIMTAFTLIIHNILSWYSCIKILKINTLKVL